MINTISFDLNNRQKMRLTQRGHDGKTLISIIDKDGFPGEIINDDEAFISPDDFVMLINYYRMQKRAGKPIL